MPTTPVHEADLGLGIDQFHPETKLAEGYVTELVNGIARSTGTIVKRPGWRQAAGYVPFRGFVEYQEYPTNGGQITLSLDPAYVDASQLTPGPILIVGRVQQLAGAPHLAPPYGAAVYCPTFTVQTLFGVPTLICTVGLPVTGFIELPGGGLTYSSWIGSQIEVDVYGLLVASAAATPQGVADLRILDAAFTPDTLLPYDTTSRDGLVLVRGGIPYVTSAGSGVSAVDASAFQPATPVHDVRTPGGTTRSGPAFFATAPSPAPTRGYLLTADASAFGHRVPVVSATYSAGTGRTTYRLRAVGWVASTSLSAVIRAGIDRLSVLGSSWDSLDGDFSVFAVTSPDADHIDLDCVNEANAAVDQQHSDADLAGLGGVLTDSVSVVSTVLAPAGSRLTFSNTVLDGADVYLQPGSDGASAATRCVAGPFDGVYAVSSNISVHTQRSAFVVPVADARSLLRGDELVDDQGLLRVIRNVNVPSVTATLSHSGADPFITVTLLVGTTDGLSAGDHVYIQVGAAQYGDVPVLAVTGATTFRVTGTGTGANPVVFGAVRSTPASVTVAAGIGTATLNSGVTTHLRAGDYVMLAGGPDGEVQVLAVPTAHTFTFSSAAATGYNAAYVHDTVGLEHAAPLTASTTLRVNRRWLAIPSAYDVSLAAQPFTAGSTAPTPITTKPFLTPTDRSVTDDEWTQHVAAAAVGKAVYFTDGLNPVKKYDGSTMYDAGIPAQPPLTYLLKRESESGIVNPNTAYPATGIPTAYKIPFSVPGQASAFTVGDPVYIRGTVFGYCHSTDFNNGANGKVRINKPGTPATNQLITALAPGAQIQFWPTTSATPETVTGIVMGQTYYLGHTPGAGSFYFLYSSPQAAYLDDGVTDRVVVGSMTAGVDVLVTGERGNHHLTTGPLDPVQKSAYTTVTAVDDSGNTITVADPVGNTVFYGLATQVISGTSTRMTYTGATVGLAVKSVALAYYTKLRMVDVNGNVTYSAGCGALDNVVRIGVPTEIRGVISNFPLVHDRPLARLEWEVYRTVGSLAVPPYALVASGAYDYTTSPHPAYLYFTDATQIATISGADAAGGVTAIGQTDPNSTLRSGADAGPAFDRPPLARFAATIDSRLVLANYKSPHRMTIAFRRRAAMPILPTVQFHPRFLIKRGTTPPAFDNVYADGFLSFSVSAPASTGGVVGAAVQGGPALQIDNSTLQLPVATPLNRFMFNFDIDRNTDHVGGDTYGLYHVPANGTIGQVANPGVTALCTVTGISVNINFPSAASLAQFATGQIVYIVQQPDRQFYLGKSSATVGQLYTNLIDALAGDTTKAVPKDAAAGSFTVAVGVLNAYPEYQAAEISGDCPVILDWGLIKQDAQYNDVGWDTIAGHAPSLTSSLEQQLAYRFAAAINASQAAYVGSNVGLPFTPFVYARAGNDVGFATLVIESLDPNQPFTFSYLPFGVDGLFEVYVNGIAYVPNAANYNVVGSSAVASQQQLFPSRVSVSYRNYPEIHDNPYAQDASTSDSAIDVSPDDGQEVTAVRPLFGASFSTAALQNQYLLVFKNRAAYLVDVAQKTVNFINTSGHGCEFPRSVSETYGGVMFADHTGMHMIDVQDKWVYKGRMMERYWRGEVDVSADRNRMTAAHSMYHNLWRLAVPTLSGDTTTIAYDHTRESDTVAYGSVANAGAWSRADGTSPIAYATFGFDDYYADSATSQVYVERRDGLPTDYRDYIEQPIQLDVQFRPMDFGIPGNRKHITSLVASFRTEVSTSGTTISTAIDLDGVWRFCDAFQLDVPVQDTNLTDQAPLAVKTLSFSAQYQKFQYLQTRIQNAALDEGVEVAELTFNIEPLSDGGIRQAAKTVATPSAPGK